VNEQPPSNMQFDHPSDQPNVRAPIQQPPRESRVGWYVLGCIVLFLIVAVLLILAGLFVAVAPVGGR
jgi:hypothetical protein